MTARFRYVVYALVFLASASGVWASQRYLDARRPEEGFRELMYLPDGTALKVVALGFDAPLADVIYLRSLIYTSTNLRFQADGAKEAKHKYLHRAFDVVTDLNPGFDMAYFNGALLLSACGKPEKALDIMEKALKRFPDDYRLHLHLAIMAEYQMKDLELAKKHYRAAVECPDVPPAVMDILVWLERGEDRMRTPEEELDMRIRIWRDVLEDPTSPKNLRNHAEANLQDLLARRVALELTSRSKEFLKMTNRAPTGIDELHHAGFLDEPPLLYYEDDEYLFLPDGTVRSKRTALAEAEEIRHVMESAVRKYAARHDGARPDSLDELVGGPVLKKLPEHPLAPLGYGFSYDPETGEVSLTEPDAPSSPVERG